MPKIKGQYKELRGLSGFGWDAINSLVTATEEVWESYLSKHKKHRPFDAFSNGVTGGNQSIGMSGLEGLNVYAGSDDGEGEGNDEEDTDGRANCSSTVPSTPLLSTPLSKTIENRPWNQHYIREEGWLEAFA
ncbi:hypothetical protein C8R44DRAFT_887821 [Mycena epipterygia]|nr:hypothetical protein C8R44DRAFT_887821 [Mycena epipterygia]